MPSQRKKKRQMNYEELKEEMLASNKDPSRDVLQSLLNPYSALDNYNAESQDTSVGDPKQQRPRYQQPQRKLRYK